VGLEFCGLTLTLAGWTAAMQFDTASALCLWGWTDTLCTLIIFGWKYLLDSSTKNLLRSTRNNLFINENTLYWLQVYRGVQYKWWGRIEYSLGRS